jgi:hypothetical protein
MGDYLHWAVFLKNSKAFSVPTSNRLKNGPLGDLSDFVAIYNYSILLLGNMKRSGANPTTFEFTPTTPAL